MITKTSWVDDARRMRMEGQSVDAICATLKKAPTTVRRAVRGISYSPPPSSPPSWRNEAIRLRQEEGLSQRQIAAIIGVGESTIQRAIRGIAPNDFVPPSSEWHEQARQMRREGKSLARIARHFQVGEKRVAKVCQGIVLDGQAARQSGSAPFQRRSILTQGYAHGIDDEITSPDQQRHNRLRSRIQRLMQSYHHNRKPSPITLPRVSILESVLAE